MPLARRIARAERFQEDGDSREIRKTEFSEKAHKMAVRDALLLENPQLYETSTRVKEEEIEGKSSALCSQKKSLS